MIRGTVANQVRGRPVGTTTSWGNPASGNSGYLKLLKKISGKNQECEEIEYPVRSGGTPVYTEHYNFMSCLQSDGTWKSPGPNWPTERPGSACLGKHALC
jgi:hypothetical protein